MEERINEVIAELSRIEHTAVTIHEDAEKEKKRYTKEIEDKIVAFDKELKKQYEDKLSDVKNSMQQQEDDDIATWHEETDVILSHLEKSFQKKHKQWAEEIFRDLIS